MSMYSSQEDYPEGVEGPDFGWPESVVEADSTPAELAAAGVEVVPDDPAVEPVAEAEEPSSAPAPVPLTPASAPVQVPAPAGAPVPAAAVPVKGGVQRPVFPD